MRTLLALLLAAHAGAALAQYKCTAADGAITFQQTPCIGAKSEEKLNVVPNGHPPSASTPASGARPVPEAVPAAGAGDSVDKRMLAAYEKQHQRDQLVKDLEAARDEKAGRTQQRQEAVAAAHRQFGGDPANAGALRDALSSIDSRYNALDELGESRIRAAQQALDQWDRPLAH